MTLDLHTGKAMSQWMFQLSIFIASAATITSILVKTNLNRAAAYITAGIILGPSFLGDTFPRHYRLIFDDNFLASLKAMSEIALALLAFEITFHLARTNELRRKRSFPIALSVAVCGAGFSFVAGGIIAILSHEYLAPTFNLWTYGVYCGIASTATALPVLVQIITEHESNQTSAGIAIEAATYLDFLAWMGVAFLLASFNLGTGSIYATLGNITQILILFGICLKSAQPVASICARFVTTGNDKSITIWALVTCLVFSVLTTSLGFHSIMGAIIASTIFMKIPDFAKIWAKHVGTFATSFLLPVFFLYSGMQISVSSVLTTTAAPWLLAFIIVGTASKVLGGYLGARMCRVEKKIAREVGAMINTKGAIDLMILNLGLQLEVIPLTTYSILAVAALFSAASAPLLIKNCDRGCT